MIENVFVPIDIFFKYHNGKDKNQFEIIKSSIKEKSFEDRIKNEDPKKKYISFKTIEAFARYFPNLTIYQNKDVINPIDIMKELLINEKISIYFQFIKERIMKKRKVEKEEYETLYSGKIKDYIMDKLYDKIYPLEFHENDMKIYKVSVQLSSIDPRQLLNKDYIFDNTLPDILNEFTQIKKNKSPYKKLNNIKKIMEYIESLIKFNEGIDKEIGAEDITPVLHYIFIKAQPDKIYTDIEYIKLFLENNGQYENALINFQSMCDVLINSEEKYCLKTKEN